jgi:hypothetical protein
MQNQCFVVVVEQLQEKFKEASQNKRRIKDEIENRGRYKTAKNPIAKLNGEETIFSKQN